LFRRLTHNCTDARLCERNVNRRRLALAARKAIEQKRMAPSDKQVELNSSSIRRPQSRLPPKEPQKAAAKQIAKPDKLAEKLYAKAAATKQAAASYPKRLYLGAWSSTQV